MFPFNVSFLFVLVTKTGNPWSFMFPCDSCSRGIFLFSSLPTRDWETLLNTLFVQLRPSCGVDPSKPAVPILISSLLINCDDGRP